MSFDATYKRSSGLTYSTLGLKGTHTRIVSMNSPELTRLREELKTFNLTEGKEEVSLKDILDRLLDCEEQ
jgi:hypothetical protein